MKKCPRCGGEVLMVEYELGDKYHYDGVSEFACGARYLSNSESTCEWRIGKWCEEELTKNQVEPPFCNGGGHPRVIVL